MSKEEAERANAQVRDSSMPPRERASEPARALPSTPPETDDIDTDWGVEQPAAPATQAAAQPVSVTVDPSATPNVTGTPPTQPPAEEPRPISKRAAAPPPAAPPLVPGVRPNRLRSHTLLGMPEPKLSTTPQAESPALEAAGAAAPAEASATATPVSTAPTATKRRQNPVLSRTLIGIAEPLPPAPTPQAAAPVATPTPEPRTALPTPVPDAPIAAEPVRSSVPPPVAPPAPAATPSVSAPSVSAPSVSAPSVSAPAVSAPEAVREQARFVQPVAPPGPTKGSGRAIVWLAVGGLALGVAGYVATHRSRPQPVSAEVQAAIPAALPSPAATLTTEATPEPTSAAAALSAAPSADSAAPSAASAAPSAASGSSAAPGVVTITVKSVPPKARVFHFGKQVGITPWVVELKPGEHHAYEVGFPGRVTRKLVLDGSKTEITVGLKPAP